MLYEIIIFWKTFWPVYNANAPPCENPPRMIRLGWIPAEISDCIIDWIFAVAFFMPSSSSGPYMSSVFYEFVKSVQHDYII